jgi:pimeloyl-ACP methyl ester carboxylesterase
MLDSLDYRVLPESRNFQFEKSIPNTNVLRVEFVAPHEFKHKRDFRVEIDKGLHARECFGGGSLFRNLILTNSQDYFLTVSRHRQRFFHVTAVHLPFTTLAEDAARVKRTMALQDGPVLLVGHSYGGAVITEAGDDPKVAGLVYVAAFAPDQGQSVGDLNSQYAEACLEDSRSWKRGQGVNRRSCQTEMADLPTESTSSATWAAAYIAFP